jgi:hypothetical protein
MIFVCEPQIRGFGHEKVNSGFLYGLRLAFPEKKIVFYAEKGHLEAISKIIVNDGIKIANIEFVAINFTTSNPIMSFISYFFLFQKILKRLRRKNSDKLFLLSITPKILYILKGLKRKAFSETKFTMVLHGAYEDIGIETQSETIAKYSGWELFKYILGRFWRIFHLFDLLFYFKKEMLRNSSDHFRYIFLSEHIRENSSQYIDLSKVPNYVVPLPTFFREFPPATTNTYVKFAIFGRGDYEMLNKIATELDKREIRSNYEIRIIGKDYQGLENFSHITCSSPGVKLLRSEMERQVLDIDIILIVYDKSKYRFSCSGSVFESMSYAKPIFHFESDCLKNYNRADQPIGLSARTIDEFADNMVEYINNYHQHIEQLEQFRNNILDVRKRFTIESSIDEIRASFSWNK